MHFFTEYIVEIIITIFIAFLVFFDKYMNKVRAKDLRHERIKTILNLLVATKKKIWINIVIDNKSSLISGVVDYFDERGNDIFQKIKDSRFGLKIDSQDIEEYYTNSIKNLSLKPQWQYGDEWSIRFIYDFDYYDYAYYKFLTNIGEEEKRGVSH